MEAARIDLAQVIEHGNLERLSKYTTRLKMEGFVQSLTGVGDASDRRGRDAVAPLRARGSSEASEGRRGPQEAAMIDENCVKWLRLIFLQKSLPGRISVSRSRRRRGFGGAGQRVPEPRWQSPTPSARRSCRSACRGDSTGRERAQIPVLGALNGGAPRSKQRCADSRPATLKHR